MFAFLRSKAFWTPFVITTLLVGGFFAWELNLIPGLPSFPRPPVTPTEMIYTFALGLLLALNVGLFQYQKKLGTCPLGAKRATGVAGTLGAVTLLCPACLLLPITLFGMSLSLAILAPFLPLLRIIALLLLIVSTKMLWPTQ